jgi:hypothetical protein
MDKTKRTTKILNFRTEARRVEGKRTLEADGFVADIFVNEQVDPPVHHYVVMKKGSIEILAWGQERSAEVADRAARDCMTSLSRRASATG